MAGDWIPYQLDLPHNPKVWELSDLLSEECRTIVGLLMEFWGWADVHVSSDGYLRVTAAQIDRQFRVEGFAAALRKVGWLGGRDRELSIPGLVFGDTAKARALESKAKNLRRRGKKADAETPPQSDDVSDTCPTNSPTDVRQLSDTNDAKCPTTGQDRTVSISNPPPARAKPTEEEVIQFARDEGLNPSHALSCFLHYEAKATPSHWIDGNGTPITGWQHKVRSWCMDNHRKGIASKSHKSKLNDKDRRTSASGTRGTLNDRELTAAEQEAVDSL